MKSSHVNLLPVRYPVYQAVSELNHSLEQTIGKFEQLASFKFLRHDCLKAYQVVIEEIRALANHELLEVLGQREFCNMAYYERLRLKWQDRFKDLSDVHGGGKRYKRPLRPPQLRQHRPHRKSLITRTLR